MLRHVDPVCLGWRLGLGTEEQARFSLALPPAGKEPQVKDWLIIALLAVAAGLVFNAIFPRYEWNVQRDGASVVVFDRWQGRFQRADFEPDGTLRGWPVYVPF